MSIIIKPTQENHKNISTIQMWPSSTCKKISIFLKNMLTSLFYSSQHSLTQADRQVVKSDPGIKIHFPAQLIDGRENLGKLSIGKKNFTVHVSNYNQNDSSSLIHAISELSSEDLTTLKEKLEKAEKAKKYFSLLTNFNSLIEEIKLGSSNDIVRLEAELVKETRDLTYLNNRYKYELENLNNNIKELEKLEESTTNPIPQAWETMLIEALNEPIHTTKTKITLEVLFKEHALSVGITEFTCCEQLFKKVFKDKSHPCHALLVSKAKEILLNKGIPSQKDKSLLGDHLSYLIGRGFYSDALLIYSGVISQKVDTKESLSAQYNNSKKTLETKISLIQNQLSSSRNELKTAQKTNTIALSEIT